MKMKKTHRFRSGAQHGRRSGGLRFRRFFRLCRFCRSGRVCRCGGGLTGDEIALYKKLVFRGADRYLCLTCLAEDLNTDREKLTELIDYFHRTGICTLFARYPEES